MKKKNTPVLATVVTVIVIVGLRIYRKYERQQVKAAQERQMILENEQRLQFLKEQELETQKARQQKRYDSINAVQQATMIESKNKCVPWDATRALEPIWDVFFARTVPQSLSCGSVY